MTGFQHHRFWTFAPLTAIAPSGNFAGMMILAYIAFAILLMGAAAFGTLIVMSTIGHRRAWIEYKEHSRVMIARNAAARPAEPSTSPPQQ